MELLVVGQHQPLTPGAEPGVFDKANHPGRRSTDSEKQSGTVRAREGLRF